MKLVILDRDGVINQDSPDYIKSADEWLPMPGSLEAIAKLTHAGFQVAVATNQAGLAKGKFDQGALEAMHEKMLGLVEGAGGQIDLIVYCPHHPDENCTCRKPQPGLLREIERELGVPLAGVPFVGDKLSDINAARNAGCKPVLVLTGKGEQTLADYPELNGQVDVYKDLAEFVESMM